MSHCTCANVNCETCRCNAIHNLFGTAFFDETNLTQLLQQTPHPSRKQVRAFLHAHSTITLQPIHFCLLQQQSHLHALTPLFVARIIAAKQSRRSRVRRGMQYNAALNNWSALEHHFAQMRNGSALPAYHWCCAYHKSHTEKAFQLYVKMVTNPQSFLHTEPQPSSHQAPAWASPQQTTETVLPLDSEILELAR